jgi:myosin-crossreactive antigen
MKKKDNDLFKLETEYELILDTYEILNLELENTTLTTEILTLKQYENNKNNLRRLANVQKKIYKIETWSFLQNKKISSKKNETF